jgi:UDP-N-acetylglucosamine 2-epimerase (non-hydrolysing)
MHKILTIFGTRPEAIKLSPVIKELSKHPQKFKSVIGVTGQHDELLNQVLNLFKIKPDFNLMVMQKNQSLSELTSSILKEIGERISEIKPDIILIQGDTTTVFATALAAFYQKIKIGHVEAGLRTDDKYQPFPEEMNRCMTDQMSDLFFAPTETNRLNLLKNGISDHKIHVTGNTIVDALLDICSLDRTFNNNVLHSFNGKMVLVTAHRRENFGKPLENVFQAIRKLAGMYPDIQFICPVHPNPHVRDTAYGILSGLINVTIIAPVDYLSFVQLMGKAHFILTDSGGIQEEAPSLNKPLLILRNKTERPEVVIAGGAKIVGTSKEMIVHEFTRLIEDDDYYKSMSNIKNPYGDGTAAKKIVKILQEYL